jgi:hypothetical protein
MATLFQDRERSPGKVGPTDIEILEISAAIV